MKNAAIGAFILAVWLAISGCGGSSHAGPGGPPPPPVTPGNMYAVNHVTGDILRFSAGASGNAGGIRIKGSGTVLQTPIQPLVDGTNDRLFVTDGITGSVVIFEHINAKSGTGGTFTPDRIISGAATTLSGPQDMALDAARDELYVSDTFKNTIDVFAPASTVNGNVAPVRSINLGFVPSAFLLDASNNRLFIGDSARRVLVYDNASTLNLNAIANRVIAGAATQLGFIAALQLDANGRLLVLNSSVSFNGITIYANAASANGDVAPAVVITSAIKFVSPVGMVVSSTGELFVADAGTPGVLVFDVNATGNAAPLRALSGQNTGFQDVPGIGNLSGITLDHAR